MISQSWKKKKIEKRLALNTGKGRQLEIKEIRAGIKNRTAAKENGWAKRTRQKQEMVIGKYDGGYPKLNKKGAESNQPLYKKQI